MQILPYMDPMGCLGLVSYTPLYHVFFSNVAKVWWCFFPYWGITYPWVESSCVFFLETEILPETNSEFAPENGPVQLGKWTIFQP